MNIPDVKYLVVTHHHWDHTFGLNEWNIVTIANQNTYDYMKTYCLLKYDDPSLEEAKKNKIFKNLAGIKEEIDKDLYIYLQGKWNDTCPVCRSAPEH